MSQILNVEDKNPTKQELKNKSIVTIRNPPSQPPYQFMWSVIELKLVGKAEVLQLDSMPTLPNLQRLSIHVIPTEIVMVEEDKIIKVPFDFNVSGNHIKNVEHLTLEGKGALRILATPRRGGIIIPQKLRSITLKDFQSVTGLYYFTELHYNIQGLQTFIFNNVNVQYLPNFIRQSRGVKVPTKDFRRIKEVSQNNIQSLRDRRKKVEEEFFKQLRLNEEILKLEKDLAEAEEGAEEERLERISEAKREYKEANARRNTERVRQLREINRELRVAEDEYVGLLKQIQIDKITPIVLVLEKMKKVVTIPQLTQNSYVYLDKIRKINLRSIPNDIVGFSLDNLRDIRKINLRLFHEDKPFLKWIVIGNIKLSKEQEKEGLGISSTRTPRLQSIQLGGNITEGIIKNLMELYKRHAKIKVKSDEEESDEEETEKLSFKRLKAKIKFTNEEMVSFLRGYDIPLTWQFIYIGDDPDYYFKRNIVELTDDQWEEAKKYVKDKYEGGINPETLKEVYGPYINFRLMQGKKGILTSTGGLFIEALIDNAVEIRGSLEKAYFALHSERQIDDQEPEEGYNDFEEWLIGEKHFGTGRFEVADYTEEKADPFEFILKEEVLVREYLKEVVESDEEEESEESEEEEEEEMEEPRPNRRKRFEMRQQLAEEDGEMELKFTKVKNRTLLTDVIKYLHKESYVPQRVKKAEILTSLLEEVPDNVLEAIELSEVWRIMYYITFTKLVPKVTVAPPAKRAKVQQFYEEHEKDSVPLNYGQKSYIWQTEAYRVLETVIDLGTRVTVLIEQLENMDKLVEIFNWISAQPEGEQGQYAERFNTFIGRNLQSMQDSGVSLLNSRNVEQLKLIVQGVQNRGRLCPKCALTQSFQKLSVQPTSP